ncbi:MAG: hypothetical protein ABIC96_00935 [Patescibacteria group bacterium]
MVEKIELVIDLDTGKQSLRHKRAGKSVLGQAKTPAPTRQWWERTGLKAFNYAAEGWVQSESVMFAEEFGRNVEFPGPQMSRGKTEESLRKTFWTARRSSIASLEVVRMIRAETLNLEVKLGTEAQR